MKIISFDLSLTRTGWCENGVPGVLVPPKGYDRGMARLRWIRNTVLMHAQAGGADIVVLEGYGFASGRGHGVREMGELGGVVRLALYDAAIPYVDVPPASLKKYATGKGNAGKELVLVEAVKRLRYEGSDNNEADAAWLWWMAQDAYGLLLEPLVPKAQRESLSKVQWLRVAGRAVA